MMIGRVWSSYIRLFRQEWFKIMHTRRLGILLLLGTGAYTWMTWSYYQWSDPVIAERILSFPYAFGTLITGMTIILTQAHHFNREHVLRMFPLLAGSRYGQRLLTGAKTGAALLFSLCVSLLLWGYHLTCHALWFGWPDFTLPLSTLERYEHTPLDLSIGAYCWLQVGLHLLGVCAFSLFVLLLSSRLRSVLIVYFVSGIALALPFFIRPSLEINGWADLPFLLLKYIPPTEIMRVEGFFTFTRTLSLDSWRFALPVEWPATYAILFALLCIWRIFRKPPSHKVA